MLIACKNVVYLVWLSVKVGIFFLNSINVTVEKVELGDKVFCIGYHVEMTLVWSLLSEVSLRLSALFLTLFKKIKKTRMEWHMQLVVGCWRFAGKRQIRRVCVLLPHALHHQASAVKAPPLNLWALYLYSGDDGREIAPKLFCLVFGRRRHSICGPLIGFIRKLTIFVVPSFHPSFSFGLWPCCWCLDIIIMKLSWFNFF